MACSGARDDEWSEAAAWIQARIARIRRDSPTASARPCAKVVDGVSAR